MKIDKSIVIHQPNFLPWLGYFAKLIYAKKLIVLDNVMFSKRKHIDRVQIINSEGNVLWIGLPIGERHMTPCNKIYFEDKNHIIKIIKTIRSSYSKARFFKENFEFIEKMILESITHSNLLSEIDLFITIQLLEHLKIDKPVITRSSDFLESTFLTPTDRIIYLCEKANSSKLIVGSVEATEIHEVKKLNKFGISMLLQDYKNKHPEYFQTRRSEVGFAKGLSVIDCILNIGTDQTKTLLHLKPIEYGK